MLHYREQRKIRQAGFALTSSGFKTAALPIELSAAIEPTGIGRESDPI